MFHRFFQIIFTNILIFFESEYYNYTSVEVYKQGSFEVNKVI